MRELRYLVAFTFLSGIFFYAFTISIYNQNKIDAAVNLILSILDSVLALKSYDQVKVRK